MGIFNFGKNNDADSEQPHQDGVDPVHQATNDDLLALWRKVTLDQSDDNMGTFLEELVEHSSLITLVLSDEEVPTKADGHLDFDQELELHFPLLTGQDDQTFQPFFTDWQAALTLLDQWTESGNQDAVDQAQGIVINFAEMVQFISSNPDVRGAVINPFADNITLDRDSLLDLDKQAKSRHETEEQPVHVGDGRKAPDGLLETLVDKFAADGQVQRAWMRTLTMGDAQSFFLILDMPERDDQDQFFDDLTVLANEYLDAEDIGLTIAPYSDELAGATNGAVPFYAK
ncbi:SseB family protein [Lacticaseibacillus sp. GG6-2]